MDHGQDRDSAAPRLSANQDPGDRWGEMMLAGQRGDGAAYHRLLSELDPWLRGFYARRLPSGQVDDAAQDALIAVHGKRHTYQAGRPFRPWLVAIARYKWIDRLRAMQRRPTHELPSDIPVNDHEAAVTSAMVLEALLGQLKPSQAIAIRMTKLQGYSVEETATATSQSPSLVKVNVHRGLAKLSALINSGDDEP